jgi:lipopolysaccharide transport system ATP-binding protein
MRKGIAVKLYNVSKVYKLYDKPIDRLKEALHPFKKKYHKDFYALKNINLEIKKGEVLGIVGVNGAGKSTLLKIIAGVLNPTTGRVNVNGKLNAILELGTGLKPEMTGVQNIKLNLQINGIYDNIEKLTNEIIEFADIGEYIYQPVKTYSSGMKARLGFAIATCTNPDILIVDEVLAVGDVLFQRKCYNRIEKLFKDGKTVIFVSHSAQSIIEFCSRAVLLYDKEIIMDDTPKKVTDFYQKLVFSKDKEKVINELFNKSKKQQFKLKYINNFEKSEFKYSRNFYVKDMVSKPKVINNVGLILNKIFILDENNEIVNILETGKKYKLYCSIDNADLNNLTFGISIQNIKGISLSCSREKLKFKNFKEKISFFWHFKCHLLNNKYFIKIDFRNGKEELYYQNTDCLFFEVKNNRQENKMCFVDLEQKMEVIS